MINLFIIEDHNIVCNGLCAILNGDPGITVIGKASTAAAALEFLEQGQVPDVILTDLHLREVTGIDLAVDLKKRYPSVKLMVLTMEDGMTYLSRALLSGISGYLLKDTGPDELVHAVHQVYHGRQFICSSLTTKIAIMLTSASAAPAAPDIEISFSSRELEILKLIADGYTNVEMADKLFTSRRTVEGHRQSMLNKTGVRNTAELVKFAMQHRLLEERQPTFPAF